MSTLHENTLQEILSEILNANSFDRSQESAPLRRLMYEVEVFTRFAGLGKKLEPVDVIQAWLGRKWFHSLELKAN